MIVSIKERMYEQAFPGPQESHKEPGSRSNEQPPQKKEEQAPPKEDCVTDDSSEDENPEGQACDFK